MTELETEVYKTSDREITVEESGRKITFLFNPQTGYALVPASVYASEQNVMNALREHETVNGIFNHDNISEL